ncbi:MAG TPA: ribonuclease Z [Saprospiraceae bacterium]|nr:ribonuclease Z [Saprospiraceae bacterium]
MNRQFEIKVLGCNSAMPAHGRNPTSQYLRIHKHHFLIDCGEGTQKTMGRWKIPRQSIRHIFISHLHGDHYFGLPGLINSMILQGRKEPLTIFSPPGLNQLIAKVFDLAGAEPTHEILFKELTHEQGAHKICALENVDVFAFPLKHRIPCYGYLFQEKQTRRNLNPEMLQKYAVPREQRQGLQDGKDYVLSNGALIPNEKFLIDPPENRSYAFCTDTLYLPGLSDILQGTYVLYHEATFEHELLEKAKLSFHTTAKEAAWLARDAEVKHLILGHYSSRYKSPKILRDEARQEFSNTHLAVEGTSYFITRHENVEKTLHME